jgi:serine protease Do
MRSFAHLLALFLLATASAARAADVPPSMANLAAQLLPSVVSIAAMAPAATAPKDDDDDDDDDSALRTADNTAGDVVPPPKTIESLGSGFVFDPSGYILTNNHVVSGANAVTVTFPDGSVYNATIAGRDKDADLAVLKIQADHPLPYVKFGDSAKMRVGDWVLAIGNPFGLPGSSSAGIVSALHRQIGDTSFDDFIQTDAAINRGNSGGPLFNMKGEVIGVNSAIEAPSGNSDGVGFSIPSAMAAPVAQALAHDGVMQRGWLGVATAEVTPQIQGLLGLSSTNGALVGNVSPGGPSDGVLQTGDVIVGLDGVALADPRALLIRTAEIPVGHNVVVRFYRNGGVGQANVTIGAKPPPLDEVIASPAPATPPAVLLKALGLGLAGKAAPNGVSVISATGPAAKAGIIAGDVIEQVNGQNVSSAADLQAQVKALGNMPPIFLVSGDNADGNNPGPRWIPVPAG